MGRLLEALRSLAFEPLGAVTIFQRNEGLVHPGGSSLARPLSWTKLPPVIVWSSPALAIGALRPMMTVRDSMS